MGIYSIRFATLGMALLMLAACGSVSQFSLPGNRFDLPDTMEQGQYLVAVENATATEVEIFEPGTSYPPRIDDPELTARSGLNGLRFARGMSDRMELQVQTLPFLSDDGNGFPAVRLKYRVAENRAITAGIGLWDKENRTYGNPAYYNDMQAVALDFAGIAAWRINENWRLYGGPWLSWVQYSGQWRRESTGATDLKDSFSGSASQYGVNVGLAWQLGGNWSLLGEVAGSRFQWQDSEASHVHAGVQLQRPFR